MKFIRFFYFIKRLFPDYLIIKKERKKTYSFDFEIVLCCLVLCYFIVDNKVSLICKILI